MKRSAVARSAAVSPDEIQSRASPSTASVAARSCALTACTSAAAASSGAVNVFCAGAAASVVVAANAVKNSVDSTADHWVAHLEQSLAIVISMAFPVR